MLLNVYKLVYILARFFKHFLMLTSTFFTFYGFVVNASTIVYVYGNKLPAVNSLPVFHRRLKTHLFTAAFGDK